MGNAQLRKIIEAMVDDAAKRLLVADDIKGVAITLIHEDTDLPLGTLAMRKNVQQRDIVLGIQKLSDTQEILTRLLMTSMNGRTSDAREDNAGVGVEGNVGNVPDGSRPADQTESTGPQPAAEESAGESS